MAVRPTGKSTAQALEAIAKAMMEPGKRVKIWDHHGSATSHRYQMDLIETTIDLLKLKGFTLSRAAFTVTYSVEEFHRSAEFRRLGIPRHFWHPAAIAEDEAKFENPNALPIPGL